MVMKLDVSKYWESYAEEISDKFKQLEEIGLPSGQDFFWITLHPQDLRGLPLTINPARKNQQQEDGWEHEEIFSDCIPQNVELTDEFTATPAALEALRDSTAEFLSKIGVTYIFQSNVPYLFSLSDDGIFIDLRDGRKISAWNLEKEFEI
jgi:hypothetical protein